MRTGKWLIVIVVLALGVGNIYADSEADKALKQQQKKDMLTKLTKGTAFQAGENKYVILPELTLEPIQQRGKAEIKENEIGVLGQRKIVRKVVKDTTAKSSSSGNMQAHTNAVGSPISNDRLVNWRGTVVLNQRTGGFGLMTGNIMVQYTDGTDVSALAQSVHLKKFKDFPHLKTVFFIIPAGTDIFQAVADLKLQDGITAVETEVIEHFATPR
jgi:hypothetical protein